MDPSVKDLVERLANRLHEHTSLYEGHEDPLVVEARSFLSSVAPKTPANANDADLTELTELLIPVVKSLLYRFSKPLHPIAFHEKQVGPEDSNSRYEVWCYERHSRKWELRVADRGDTHWMPHWGLPLP